MWNDTMLVFELVPPVNTVFRQPVPVLPGFKGHINYYFYNFVKKLNSFRELPNER
jgi:hypothetical protein